MPGQYSRFLPAPGNQVLSISENPTFEHPAKIKMSRDALRLSVGTRYISCPIAQCTNTGKTPENRLKTDIKPDTNTGINRINTRKKRVSGFHFLRLTGWFSTVDGLVFPAWVVHFPRPRRLPSLRLFLGVYPVRRLGWPRNAFYTVLAFGRLAPQAQSQAVGRALQNRTGLCPPVPLFCLF